MPLHALRYPRSRAVGYPPESQDRRANLDRLWWGLIPHWCKDADGGRKPINAKAETVATASNLPRCLKRRRCLVPIENFFEWKAIQG